MRLFRQLGVDSERGPMTKLPEDHGSNESASRPIFPVPAKPITRYSLLPISEAGRQRNHFSQVRYWLLFGGLLYLSSLIASIVQLIQQLGISTAAQSDKNPFGIEVVLVLFPLLASLYMFLQSPAGLTSIEIAARSRIRNVIENCFIGIALIGIAGQLLSAPSGDFELPLPQNSDESFRHNLVEAGAALTTIFLFQPVSIFLRAFNWDSFTYILVIATAGWILLFTRSVFSELPEQRSQERTDKRREARRLERDIRRLLEDPWTFPQTMRALHRRLTGDYDQRSHYVCKYLLAVGWRLFLSSLLALTIIALLLVLDLAEKSGGWLLMAWAESATLAVTEYLLIRRLRKSNFLLITYLFLVLVPFFGIGLIHELRAGNYFFIFIFVPLAVALWAWQLRTHRGFRNDLPEYRAKIWQTAWRRATIDSFASHYSWGSLVDVASLRVAFGDLNATRWRGRASHATRGFRFCSMLDPWRNKRFTWMLNFQITKLISHRDSLIAEANGMEGGIKDHMSTQ